MMVMVVKIEVYPGGSAARRKEIFRVKIASVSGSVESMNEYECSLFDEREKLVSRGSFWHRHDTGALACVMKAIDALHSPPRTEGR